MNVWMRFVLFALLISAAAQAQINPRLLEGMQWRSVGPFIAGKVDSVSGVNGQPAIAYMGTDDGGVWKSVNGGTTWFPVTDDVEAIRGITALAVAPSQPQIVYAGTGSIFGSEYSSGIWKSVDAGAHWESAGLQNAGQITALLVDPYHPDLLLASTRGIAHHEGGERGVFRSTDGGKTWRAVLPAGAQSGATGIAWANDNPRVVFATVVQTYRAPGAPGSAFRNPGPTSLYKSEDEGGTWSRVTGRNQPTVVGPIAVANHTHSQRVYMLTRAGLYRSDDGGASWSVGTKTIYTSSKQVLVDPNNPDVVYTMGTAVYRSTDGGRTLVAFKGAPGGDDPNQCWIDAINPDHIIYGGDQGASISLDGGRSWTLWYNQATAQVYKVSTDDRYPYWIYASKQDSGAIAVASRGPFGDVNGFFDWFQLPGWETGFVTPDPSDPNLIFMNSDLGFLSRLDRKTWQAQIIDPGMGSISNTSDTAFRRAVSAPIVFSPENDLYFGTQNVWKSSDGGMHWQNISPDLTAHPGKPPEPPPEGVHHGDALSSLSFSTVQPGVAWTGSNNGVVYLTRDGGQHWEDVTPPALTPYSDVNVEASRFNPAVAYASADNSRTGDYAPHMYRTRDYGKSWQSIVAGLPADQPTGSFVQVVREDPHKQGLLFAGTETSVYVSFDDGDHWQSLRLNLPTTSYRDLKIHDNDLIAGTYGRAIWILDDITPLKEMRAEIANESAHLFGPETAIRVQRDVNQDTPFPAEVPHASNPPEGAVIDYYLAQPAKMLELQILDSDGNLMRSYSNAPIPPLDQPLPPVQSMWLRPRLPLPAGAGAHRVTWDLRYPDPPAIRFNYGDTMGAVPGDTPFTPEGPLALPGNYTVKLIVDGSSHSQPLVVKEDPRIGDSSEAIDGMQKQLALAQNVVALLAASRAAYEQGTTLEAKLASAKELQASVAKLTGTFDEANIGLSGSNYAVPPVKGTVSFSRTNGQASALLHFVNYLSDRAPVASEYATYQQLCEDFNATAAAWQALQPEHPVTPLTCK